MILKTKSTFDHYNHMNQLQRVQICAKTYFSKRQTKRKYEFWQNTIGANETILQIIKEEYTLPFIETPSEAKLPNNKSALTNSAFAQEAIKDMLLSGAIKQVKTLPEVINPLSVSINSKGKKRLILDLRYAKIIFKKRI